jgi:hypothetical protein
MMDTVTYPDARVAALLNDRFDVIRVDVKNVLPAQRDLIRAARPLWTPTVAFLAGGQEVRRAVGYLPPDDFLAEAQIALGQIDLLHQELDRAFETFRSAADAYGSPEALFWAGVAAFKRSRTFDALRPVWDELQARHPDSEWARRADVWSALDG